MSANAAAQVNESAVEAVEEEVPTLDSPEFDASSSQPLSTDDLQAELAAAKESSSSPKADTEAFEKVRELLMGESMQSLRDDLHCSHRIILHRVETLHKAVTKRMDNIDKKVSALNFAVNQEVQDREELAISLSDKQDSAVQSLRNDLDEVAENLSDSNNKLEAELASQSSAQSAALQTLEQQLREQIEQRCTALSDEKLNRDGLARVLYDMAAEISGPSND